jgi:hypothetical protein
MASFSISPAVSIKETDLTAIIPAVASSVGAFAGEFDWGPVLDVTTISSETALVSRFGKPTLNTYAAFFQAANFLGYSSALRLVRVETAAQRNAVSVGTALKIKNQDQYETLYSNGAASVGMFAAKYPGSKGNSLRVSVADANTYARTLTGTVSVSAASATVTGTGTAFMTEVAVGDMLELTVAGIRLIKRIQTITDDVTLVVESVYSTGATALAAKTKWEYATFFDKAPYGSANGESVGTVGDGMHLIVIDEDGKFSGVAGTVLEKFANLSKAVNGRSLDGNPAYYKTVVNNSSSYVWWMDHPDTSELSLTGFDWGSEVFAGNFRSLTVNKSVSLVGGVDGFGATQAETISGFSLFQNPERYDISLVFAGHASVDIARWVIQNIADTRMDCMAFVSPVKVSDGSVIMGDTAESVEAILEYRNVLGVSTSYGVMDTGYKYQYDKYNDVYRWIAMSADIAGLCARTDFVSAPWYSPGGLNRGQLKNVTKLAVNPDKTMRDDLFKFGVNSVVTFPGEGTVLFGDKTLLSRASAFDAINVRRLFITIEKAIATASKYFLFELNTDLTRQLFVGMITPYLRDIQGQQGITDFMVDAGPTVNTAAAIDGNELRCNIFIKPTRSIRFINLGFIAVRSGIEFSEIEL